VTARQFCRLTPTPLPLFGFTFQARPFLSIAIVTVENRLTTDYLEDASCSFGNVAPTFGDQSYQSASELRLLPFWTRAISLLALLNKVI